MDPYEMIKGEPRERSRGLEKNNPCPPLFTIMGEHYNMLCFTWFRLLFIIVTTPVLSYSKFECPSRTEWKFRAVSNCNIPEGYHCLFNENTNEFGEFCDTRSYNDPAGHKLVLVGDLDRRDCEGTRYQPFSFSTNGMSSCIFEKTYCREEGQVIHTEGTADSDRQCRCDYTRSYAFIIKPKQSCYCVPSKEDCSCYKKPCPLGFIMTPES
ncbi:Hypothetical predicted protein [Mytilus galloprovincialis]|uniref:Uncharacterized protein n=1 Tax=Mytilus galloprovincialis TaxID=29158 RepID=A0A8B6F0Y5_MYTGA|nr:Hypothetical predicted protein [Mytilus galloprovincialis]